MYHLYGWEKKATYSLESSVGGSLRHFARYGKRLSQTCKISGSAHIHGTLKRLPPCLMRGPKTSTVITVEVLDRALYTPKNKYYGSPYLEKPNIIPEEGIEVEFLVSSIESAASMDIAAKDVDDTMLNFFGDLEQIHIFSTAGGTFYLQLVTVVLIEPLKALDEQEVHC